MIVSSPKGAGDYLADWQVGQAVLRLSNRSMERLQHALRDRDREQFQRAMRALETAAEIEPDAGAVHAVRGLVAMYVARKPDDAIVAFRKAIASDAPVPADVRLQVEVAGNLGQLLLTRGDASLHEEARRVLEKAVSWDAHNGNPLARFGNRYNLACAYALMGHTDKAFKALEESLAMGRDELGDGYGRHYLHAKDRDPDMASLRGDPRFKKLMEKYAPET